MMLHTKNQGSRRFFKFSYSANVNYVTPATEPFVTEVHEVMLQTKYQGSRLCGFRQEDFFMLSLHKPMLNM